jgi:hypothetical protein
MPRKLSGGNDGFVGNVVAAGVGAYVAKNSGSWGSLGWNLVKVVLAIVVVSVIFAVVASMTKKEKFIPTPSSEQDKKYVTPAGNVITY